MRSKTVFYNAKVYLERGRYAEGLLQEDGTSRNGKKERAGDQADMILIRYLKIYL